MVDTDLQETKVATGFKVGKEISGPSDEAVCKNHMQVVANSAGADDPTKVIDALNVYESWMTDRGKSNYALAEQDYDDSEGDLVTRRKVGRNWRLTHRAAKVSVAADTVAEARVGLKEQVGNQLEHWKSLPDAPSTMGRIHSELVKEAHDRATTATRGRTEDALSKYGRPDRSSLMLEQVWTEMLFHPEEVTKDVELRTKRMPNRPVVDKDLSRIHSRMVGGGEGAVGKLFTDPESLSPEMRVLFDEFFVEAYGLEGVDDLRAAVDEERDKLESKLRTTEGSKEARAELYEKIKVVDAFRNSGIEAMVKNDFVKWSNASEDEKPEYFIESLPKGVKETLKRWKERPGHKFIPKGHKKFIDDLDKKESSPNIDQILDQLGDNRLRDEMRDWLGAWQKDPKKIAVAIQKDKAVGIGIMDNEGTVHNMPIQAWTKAIGGKPVESGDEEIGVKLPNGNKITPGMNDSTITGVLNTLKIAGSTNADTPVIVFRRPTPKKV